MILDSTFYKNISRIVVSGGSSLVFPTDVILFCDTTTGAITLTLCEIPVDAWNTVYKLYVVDSGSNASVNNITINAPAGYTINGSASLVINTNSTTAVIRIANNKAYLASLTSGGLPLEVDSQGLLVTATTSKMDFVGIQALLTAPNSVKVTNAFISGTALQIQALATAGNLIANQWYNITNAQYGLTFNHNFNVYIPAITTNSLSTFGIGEFFNADYQKVGNYSGITGFVSQLGIWRATLAPVINDVCICDNKHYKNLTGANGVLKASADAVNWQFLPLSKTNGYIVVYNEITLGYDTNIRVVYRRDKWDNEVEWKDTIGYGSFDVFPFGNDLFLYNKVLNSIFYSCNAIVSPSGIVSHNSITNNAEVNFSTPFLVKNFVQNVIIGSTRPVEFLKGDVNLEIQRNYFEMSGTQGSSFGLSIFQENNIVKSSLEVNLLGGYTCANNEFVNSSLILNGNLNGSFDYNNLRNAGITVDLDEGIIRNNIFNDVNVTVTLNNGGILRNNVSQNSQLIIGTISLGKKFVQNTLTHNTTFQINNVANDFGSSLPKGLGNTFKYCNVQIDTFNGDCAGNTMENCQISIIKFNGSINTNNFSGEAIIEIFDMNNRNIINVVAGEFQFGSPAFVMYETYTSGSRLVGLNTIKATLDCADPTIYDAGLQTLLIPSELQDWIGYITLLNANGITISKIFGTREQYPLKFQNDFGLTNFTTVAVAGALSGEIVSYLPPPAIVGITFRLNSPDWIEIERTTSNVAITKTQIFL
jgi:hypothetical protein